VYWRKFPWIVQKLFPKLIWKLPNSEKKIYLTFDDGPCPEFTSKILDILDEKEIKASFFCLGKNIEYQPLLFDEIKKRGHFVGNHGYAHLNGWNVSRNEFMHNIEKGQKFYDNNFFRPPYGKIKLNFLSPLTKKYSVVMWDILSGDFDTRYDADNCLEFVLKNTKDGSIIVLHDNIKSGDKMISILPKIIDELRRKSFLFERL